MNFSILYDNKKRSKGSRMIMANDGNAYMYNYKTKLYEKVRKLPDNKNYLVEFNVKGKNYLQNMFDVRDYEKIIKDIVFRVLGFKNYNYDFASIPQLIKYLAKESFNNQILAGDNIDVIDCIDQSTAGGCLIAKQGKYEGNYKCFDINNSYNKFFVDYENKIPTNPKFKTVKKISKKNAFSIYRMKIDEEFLTKEYIMKFKTNRRWFTEFDIEIFDMFNITYELVIENENCIIYDTVECNFEWIEKLNTEKQNTDKNTIKCNVIKYLLSSFWGEISKFDCITQEQYGEPLNDDYFHKIGDKPDENGNPVRLYKNPNNFYKYSCGIIKPFVLSYARLRILQQIKKVEDKGYDIIFSHTDSIITNGKKKYFDLGSNIGQYKLENTGNIEIINIAKKNWL